MVEPWHTGELVLANDGAVGAARTDTITASVLLQPVEALFTVKLQLVAFKGDAIGLEIYGLDKPVVGDQVQVFAALLVLPICTEVLSHTFLSKPAFAVGSAFTLIGIHAETFVQPYKSTTVTL